MNVVLKYISFKKGLFGPRSLIIFVNDKKSSCLSAEHGAEVICKANLIVRSADITEEQ